MIGDRSDVPEPSSYNNDTLLLGLLTTFHAQWIDGLDPVALCSDTGWTGHIMEGSNRRSSVVRSCECSGRHRVDWSEDGGRRKHGFSGFQICWRHIDTVAEPCLPIVWRPWFCVLAFRTQMHLWKV